MLNFISSNTIYLATNLFRIYVLYKFLGIFFEKTHIKNGLQLFLYLLYYISNSSLYLIFSNPFINLISNLLLFFLLTFIYEGKTSTRVVSTVLIYSATMILESIVYNISVSFNLHFILEDFTIVVSNILLFMLVVILERIFGNNKILDIKPIHWMIIFCIPMGSIIIVLTAFIANYSSIFTIIIVSVLLCINIMNFYLYDVIIKYYHNKYEKDLLIQQNNAYLNQLQIIKESQENIKMLRHDMKNHIYSMQEMIKNNKRDDLEEYLKTIFEYIDVKNEYAYSGNTEVDSLLNYKIYEAVKLNANIEVNINIPKKLGVEVFDLSIILGNLLDNALDALKKTDKKRLYVKMELEKSILYITVENSYGDIINKENDIFITTKKDENNHGFGLNSVQNAIKKYNGLLDITYDEKLFLVNILLYTDNIMQI